MTPGPLLATTPYYDATCALHSGDTPAVAAEFRRCLELRKSMATESAAKYPSSRPDGRAGALGVPDAQAAKIADVLCSDAAD